MPDYNNKVIYGNDVLMDISEDTVTPNTLLSGETAHDRSGAPITGTAKQGHVIKDDTTTFTQRSNLKFENATVTDDSTNDQTIVTVGADPTAYKTSDSASTTINDTDYIPMSDTNGNKKKSLWSTIIAKIKSALGIASSGDTYLKKDGTWGTPTDTWKANTSSSEGYVASGSGQLWKGWKTNHNGVPTWRGDVIVLPTINYGSLPSQSTDSATYFKEWLVYMAANYPNELSSGMPLTAICKPNSAGVVIGNVYSGTDVHTTTKLPRYCSFIYIVLGNYSPQKFGTNDYNFYFSNVDTWRGIQNNLTSDSTSDSLSAAQGKALNAKFTDGSVTKVGTANKGSATNPIYLASGVPTACTYSLNKTVPSDAVFTDHYAWNDITGKPSTYAPSSHTHNYAGSSSAGGQANDSAKLGGASASESATASTIVKRNANGYIYAVYYNASNGAENIASYTSYVMFKDSNGWQRCTSKANLQSWLGLGNRAYDSTNYLPLTSGTLTGSLAIDKGGSSTAQGWSMLYLGNNKNVGTAGNQAGSIRIYSTNTGYIDLAATATTGSAACYLPTAGGELALKNKTVPISGGTFTGKVFIDYANGTTSTTGESYFEIGNRKAKNTAGNSKGGMMINSETAYYSGISSNAQSANVWFLLPTKTSSQVFTTTNSSSYRVKENIRDMTDEEALKLLDVNVVKFDYKEEFGGEINQSGVIAEEVIDIIPEVVDKSLFYDELEAADFRDNPPPTVDYAKFTPYLIKMIQMQQQKIEELEQRLSALES